MLQATRHDIALEGFARRWADVGSGELIPEAALLIFKTGVARKLQEGLVRLVVAELSKDQVRPERCVGGCAVHGRDGCRPDRGRAEEAGDTLTILKIALIRPEDEQLVTDDGATPAHARQGAIVVRALKAGRAVRGGRCAFG